MKKFLGIMVLSFLLSLNAKAGNISDFQIEGMSVGDSLLDYLKKDKIDNSFHATNYKSNKFKTTTLKLPLKNMIF